MNNLFDVPTKQPTPAKGARGTLEPAESIDRTAAMTMLLEANLPLEGFVEHFGHALVARGADGTLAGLIGIEYYGAAALIRSVVVARQHRRSGIGRRLVDAIIARAREEGVDTLYLLTEGAAPFFQAMGFEPIARSAVDKRVLTSSQFRTARCGAATCLARTI